VQDIRSARRQLVAPDGRHLNDDDILGTFSIDQRKDRRVSEIAAVPIVLSFDLNRLEVRRQASRREHGVDSDVGGLENLDLASADIRCVEEELRCRRRMIEPFKVDHRQKQILERIDIERIEQCRRKRVGQEVEGGVKWMVLRR
jgi:hypothetical protein